MNYYVKSDRNYYYKITKNNKKRVSEKEYNENVKKGGHPNPTIFNSLKIVPETPTVEKVKQITHKLENNRQRKYKNILLRSISEEIYKRLLNPKSYSTSIKLFNNFNNTLSNITNNNSIQSKKRKVNKENFKINVTYPNINYYNINPNINNNNKNSLKTKMNNNGKSVKVINNKSSNKIIKIFSLAFDGYSYNRYFNVLNEIIMQIYAYVITDNYNRSNPKFKFKIPKIEKIEFYEDNENSGNIQIYIKIIMEKIHKINIECDDLNENIYDNIRNYLDFLRANSLFHNDTHNDNLFFTDTCGCQMALIDFGKANVAINSPSTWPNNQQTSLNFVL